MKFCTALPATGGAFIHFAHLFWILGMNHYNWIMEKQGGSKFVFFPSLKCQTEVLDWQWLIKDHRTLAEVVELQDLVNFKNDCWLTLNEEWTNCCFWRYPGIMDGLHSWWHVLEVWSQLWKCKNNVDDCCGSSPLLSMDPEVQKVLVLVV